MGKITYKEKEKQRREVEILQKAAQLLTERGFANLNMDELAEVVGISKPTLYQHFKSKEELVSQVMIQSYTTMEEQISATLTGTPLEKITKLFRHIVKSRFGASSLNGTMDQETLWSVMRTNPIIQQRRQQAIEGLSSLVEEAKEVGEISTDIPTPIVVHAMFCLQGAFKDPGLRSEMASSEEKLDAGIDAVLQLFKHGVVPAEAK